MGALPDWKIEELDFIKPFSPGIKRENQISYGVTSYGYDVRIGNKFKVFSPINCFEIDPKNFDTKSLVNVEVKDHDYILIPPHSFVLGESVEEFDIPRDVTCIVVGKSTYARCGILINVTPLESEWVGRVTIEISNTTPLPARIYAGEGIMQAIFIKNTDETLVCKTSYKDKKGKYQNQTGIEIPKVDK